MQITFIRHGQYNSNTGHLTDEGLETMSKTALVLRDMCLNPKYKREVPAWLDFGFTSAAQAEPSLTELFQVATGIWGEEFEQAKLHAQQMPDIILSSQMTRAIESAQVLKEQIEHFGGKTTLRTGVAYLNEVQLFNSHGITRPPTRKQLCLDELNDFLKRLAQEGYQHIAIVTHQPNIQGLCAAFADSRLIFTKPTPGSILSCYVEQPEHIGDGRCFPYGRTGVCGWTEDLEEMHVDRQIKDAINRENIKMLDVPTLREKLAAYAHPNGRQPHGPTPSL